MSYTQEQLQEMHEAFNGKYNPDFTPEQKARFERLLAMLPKPDNSPAGIRRALASLTADALGANDQSDPNPLDWTLDNRAGP